jgi:integrase/recombinase XerD
MDRPTLEDYLQGLTHLSYTTHRRHQAILQALLNFAVEAEYVRVNPIAHLKQRKPDREKGEHSSDEVVRYLSPEQLAILYQVVAPQPRLHALVRLLHRTGARIAEVLALDLDSVDLNNRKFLVVGKGNKCRWCFYSQDAAQILNTYLQYHRYSEHPALFTARQPLTGEVSRLSYRTVHKNWTALLETSPVLHDLRLHDLRHTFATERVGLMGIEELRALMGHENIQTTLRYQKVTSLRAEEVAHQAFEFLLNSSAKCC